MEDYTTAKHGSCIVKDVKHEQEKWTMLVTFTHNNQSREKEKTQG